MKHRFSGKVAVAEREVSPPERETHTLEGAGSPFERQTYTIPQAAKILGISRTVAYRKGVLPTIRVAGRLLVPKQRLERMLAETV